MARGAAGTWRLRESHGRTDRARAWDSSSASCSRIATWRSWRRSTVGFD